MFYNLRLKLSKAGLTLYAHTQRPLAVDIDERHFRYEQAKRNWERPDV